MWSEAEQRTCLGCLEQTVLEGVQEAVLRREAPAFVAFSLLSDAQELIDRGLDEQARQTINRSKFILSRFVLERDPH